MKNHFSPEATPIHGCQRSQLGMRRADKPRMLLCGEAVSTMRQSKAIISSYMAQVLSSELSTEHILCAYVHGPNGGSVQTFPCGLSRMERRAANG